MKIFLSIPLALQLCLCSIAPDPRDNPNDSKTTTDGTTVSNLADLTIIAIDIPSLALSTSSSSDISLTIKNQGGVDAATFTIGLMTDFQDPTLEVQDFYSIGGFVTKATVASLASGAQSSINVPFTATFTSHSKLGAYIDSEAVVSESSEANNYMIISGVTISN